MIAIFDAPWSAHTSKTKVSGSICAIEGWRSIVDRCLIYICLLFPPQNKSVSLQISCSVSNRVCVSQERSRKFRSVLVKISFQNSMILAPFQVFSPHKPCFNEVAMQMSVITLCHRVWRKFKCRWQLSSFTCKWSRQDVFVHYVPFLWQRDLTVATVETDLWKILQTGWIFSAHCAFWGWLQQSFYLSQLTHRRSLKWSRSFVRCYIGKQQGKWGSTWLFNQLGKEFLHPLLPNWIKSI